MGANLGTFEVLRSTPLAKPLTPNVSSGTPHWSPKRLHRPVASIRTLTISVKWFRWATLGLLLFGFVWAHNTVRLRIGGLDDFTLASRIGLPGNGLTQQAAVSKSTLYPWVNVYSFEEPVLREIATVQMPGETHAGGKRLLFVGIFCRAEDITRRNLIRRTSKLLAPSSLVDVRFVICDRDALDGRPDPALWSEMQLFDDLLLLDCAENMDQGKSYDYWTSVRKQHPQYLYYMKGDSDSYVLYHNVALSLLHAPRLNLYVGHPVCYEGKPVYMAGMGYVLSQDLVYAIAHCGRACYEGRKGPEDMRVGDWLNATLSGPFSLADVSERAFHINRASPQWERVGPQAMVVHELKDDAMFFEAHRRLHTLLDVAAIREAKAKKVEDWFSGPRTSMVLHATPLPGQQLPMPSVTQANRALTGRGSGRLEKRPGTKKRLRKRAAIRSK